VLDRKYPTDDREFEFAGLIALSKGPRIYPAGRAGGDETSRGCQARGPGSKILRWCSSLPRFLSDFTSQNSALKRDSRCERSDRIGAPCFRYTWRRPNLKPPVDGVRRLHTQRVWRAAPTALVFLVIVRRDAAPKSCSLVFPAYDPTSDRASPRVRRRLTRTTGKPVHRFQGFDRTMQPKPCGCDHVGHFESFARVSCTRARMICWPGQSHTDPNTLRSIVGLVLLPGSTRPTRILLRL
jgi:hypothetical protein